MTPSHIQELRELADAIEADGAWALHNDATVAAALRACADREERAQAGITPELIEHCAEKIWEVCNRKIIGRVACTGFADLVLQSAALALQGDREKLLTALRELHEAESTPFPEFECGREDQDAWAIRKAEAHEQAVAIIAKAADLSRAIGDSNEQ